MVMDGVAPHSVGEIRLLAAAVRSGIRAKGRADG